MCTHAVAAALGGCVLSSLSRVVTLIGVGSHHRKPRVALAVTAAANMVVPCAQTSYGARGDRGI